MDTKLLLLILFATVVTSEHCAWKRPAYFSLMFEVMWKYSKEGICDSMKTFTHKIESSECFTPDEKLVFNCFNESCVSECNLYEVVRNGKFMAVHVSLNAGTNKACARFDELEDLLVKHNCTHLQELLRRLLHYCCNEIEKEIGMSVNISAKAN